MQRNKGVIAFSGGGTGGHVIPGVAVAKELKKRWKGRIVWLGAGTKFEYELIPGEIAEVIKIPSGKLRRYFSLANITDIFKIIAGIFVSAFIIIRERPFLLFSKGGYASVPPVIAAYLLKIPVLTHESDIDPGLATKINSIFADKIFVSFEKTRIFFGDKLKKRVVVTGNPVREEILMGDGIRGRKKLGCKKDEKLILFLGGSQGAKSINVLASSILEELLSRGIWIVHQTGGKEKLSGRLLDKKILNHPKYLGMDFIKEDFPDFLAAADLVVSRAGAGAIWEFAALGKPTILIPLPSSGSRGDQIRNAELLEELEATVLLKEDEISPKVLLETILELLNNKEKLDRLACNIKLIYRGDASKIISMKIIEYLEGTTNV